MISCQPRDSIEFDEVPGVTHVAHMHRRHHRLLGRRRLHGRHHGHRHHRVVIGSVIESFDFVDDPHAEWKTLKLHTPHSHCPYRRNETTLDTFRVKYKQTFSTSFLLPS